MKTKLAVESAAKFLMKKHLAAESTAKFPYLLLLGELVGAQRQKAEHEPFTSHFERRSGSSKRLRNARAKTRGEDHATPL